MEFVKPHQDRLVQKAVHELQTLLAETANVLKAVRDPATLASASPIEAHSLGQYAVRAQHAVAELHASVMTVRRLEMEAAHAKADKADKKST